MNAKPLLPPHSEEAEHSVIGALLLDQSSAERIGALRQEHFYSEQNRLVFAEILAMLAAGKPVDAVTVAEALEDRGLTERTGGLAYLGDVAANTPSASNASRYAEIVRGKALERQLLAAAETIRASVQSVGTSAEKLAAAQAAVMGITEAAETKQPRLIRDALVSAVETLEARSSGKVEAMGTGFDDLDKLLSGGLRPGNLVIVAGRPGMGKTSLATNIALHLAEQAKSAALFSMEMGESELTDRLIAQVGSVPLHDVISGNIGGESGERMLVAIERMREIPLILDDQGGLTLFDATSKARSIRRRHGLDLLVIDYLQLMSGDGDNRNAQLEPITRGLKTLAKEMGIPILLLSQLSRKCDDQKRRPVMSDLRDSGAIEQDADVIVFVYRDEIYNPNSPDKGTAEIIVGKNRQGGTGMVRLAYHGSFTRFDNLAHDWRPAVSDTSFARNRKGFE